MSVAPGRPFRLGFLTHVFGRERPTELLRRLVELFVIAEELGFDGGWVAQHHFSAEYGRLPSPLVLLAAAAQATRRIELGTAVVVLPLEDPIRLAEDAAVLDALSGGRLQLGLGTGGPSAPAFAAFGRDAEARRELFTEALARLRALLTGEPVPGSDGLRLQPPAPTVASRLWDSTTSADSAVAAAHAGDGLLLGIGPAATAQRPLADAYLAAHAAAWPTGPARPAGPPPRVAVSHGVFPGPDRIAALVDLAADITRFRPYLSHFGLDADADDTAALDAMNVHHGPPAAIVESLAANPVGAGVRVVLHRRRAGGGRRRGGLRRDGAPAGDHRHRDRPGAGLASRVAALAPGAGAGRHGEDPMTTHPPDGRPPRRLTLGAVLHGSGGHIAGWRHPLSPPDGELDLAHHIRVARTLERGTFDALFVADVVAIWGHHLDSLRRTARASHFEPLTLLAALSTVTERIGLVATATTTYNEPFHLARKFASLDHLSAGRAGWNVVTSVVPLEAGNFGRDTHLEHGLRYRRAEEFVEVVRELWDSFDDGAVVRDRASGRYYDPTGLATPEHRGRHFTVRGPLNISRPPQGHPVIFQAGSSETGKEFAARYGEVVFTGQPTLAGVQAFYADLKARAVAHGRHPDDVLVWPILAPIVASTEAEAKARFTELQELIHDEVARRLVQDNIGDLDLSGYPVDGPVPEIGATNRSKSRQDLMLGLARRENLTIRQLALRFAGGGMLAGTPESIADHIEEWFTNRGADGFNVGFPYLPGGAEDFVDQVVPELRRRGLFRSEYEETTLRGHLGLRRPPAARAARPARAAGEPSTGEPPDGARRPDRSELEAGIR